MNTDLAQPAITDYMDYRTYLSDFIAWKKQKFPSFSVRSLCLKAEITTENYLLRIIRGERNLGPKITDRLIPLIGLDQGPDDTDYFRALVAVATAKDEQSRQLCTQQLHKLKNKRKMLPPLVDNSVHKDWWVLAIWELASCEGFQSDAAWISERLLGRISVQQVKEAVELLLAKGYLTTRADGTWSPVRAPAWSTDGTADEQIRAYHKGMLEQAKQGLELSVENRGFYGLTISAKHQDLPKVKARIKTMLEELQAELCYEPNADRVYQIGSFVVPLAHSRD